MTNKDFLEENTLLSVKDIARACNCSTSTVRRIISRGEITTTLVSGSIKIHRKDFLDFLEDNKQENNRQQIKI